MRITNGRSLFNNEREKIEVSGTPNFDKIVIEGTSGWVSMESLKMLSDYAVNVIMVDKKGRLYANFSQVEAQNHYYGRSNTNISTIPTG